MACNPSCHDAAVYRLFFLSEGHCYLNGAQRSARLLCKLCNRTVNVRLQFIGIASHIHTDSAAWIEHKLISVLVCNFVAKCMRSELVTAQECCRLKKSRRGGAGCCSLFSNSPKFSVGNPPLLWYWFRSHFGPTHSEHIFWLLLKVTVQPMQLVLQTGFTLQFLYSSQDYCTADYWL